MAFMLFCGAVGFLIGGFTGAAVGIILGGIVAVNVATTR